MPCRIEVNPGVSVCGSFDGGVIGRFYKKRCDGMKLCIVMPDQGSCPGVKGALRLSGENRLRLSGGACALHVLVAVMGSVAAAAGWKVRLRVRGEREQGRHQRKAEE